MFSAQPLVTDSGHHIHELGNAETLRLDERQDRIILQALLG
jgi:hypothetical protein